MLNKKYIHSQTIARAIDEAAINDHHIPSLVLMEHAAIESAKIIIDQIDQDKKICILCGPGNNGADGMAIARLLNHKGYKVFCSIPVNGSMSEDEKIQFSIIDKLGIQYCDIPEKIIQEIHASDVIIDCLFGNGLTRDIKGIYAQIINAVNQSNKYVFAIDVPSGIHATTGEILNTAIKADTTIALDCFKEGHWIIPAKIYCGKLILVDIGIPHNIHEQNQGAIYIDEELVKKSFPKRDDHSHKGSFSKALMIGGSLEQPGAITMASKACAKSGIGTLTIMEPNCIGDILASKMDFAMHLRTKDKDGHFDISAVDLLQEYIKNYDIISLGNGMHQNAETKALVKKALSSDKKVILDADAIWALKDQKDCLNRNVPTLLTPHIKEMTYLVNHSVEEILSDPFTIVRDFINEYPNCTLLLKSDTTFIGSKNGFYVLSKPNSALAKGGSGDVLCGILTGILGHKIEPVYAAVCACYIHSKCAETKKDPAANMPEDLIDELDFVFKSLRS